MLLLATLLAIMAEVALATFVATRAWSHRPARLFVLFILALILSHVGFMVRADAVDGVERSIGVGLNLLAVGMLNVSLLLLFSAIFVPQWWAGKRPIRWIVLPYLIGVATLTLDLLGQFGLFVQGTRLVDEQVRPVVATPGGSILLGIFAASWLLHLAIIITAFVRQPKVRPALGVLFLTILIASLFGLTLNLNPQFARLSNLAQTVPIAAVMAYIIFSTRFVLPTQVALEQALKSIRDLVVVLDDERNIMYANDAAAQLNFRSGSTLAQALHAGSTDQDAINHVLAAGRRVHSTLALGQRRFTLGLTPVLDRKGRVRSELLLGRDVTEVEERTNQLEAERANLAAAVVQLEAEQREREQLEATVQELSLPVIPVLPGVLVLPLVGNVDGARANDFLQVLLGAVERERARLVLLDITGVPLL
ncbi:MAG: PAS domain-containing protein, partial [Chloroflexaceae bacterium]|nr:PAS domain-containing protein [Chloroflexaceae bacterium]